MPDHENPSLTLGSGENVAHVIIQMEPGDNLVRKVLFAEESVSGYEALTLTGLEVITKDFGWGIGICSINGVGCPPDDTCFTCNGDHFWNYTQWMTDTWETPMVGSTETLVSNNSVEGWRWGKWDDGVLLSAPQMVSAARALEWLAVKQNVVSGGYGYTGEGSMSSSTESLLAIGANNYLAKNWKKYDYSASLEKFALARSPAYAQKAAESGKFATGFVAAKGSCWPQFALKPTYFYSPTSGMYSEHAGFHAWAMMGTIALDVQVPTQATEYLKSQVFPNGGWEWNRGVGTDTNTTSLAIQTLIASGEPITSTYILEGLAYIKSAQNEDGGFKNYTDASYPFYSPKSDTNSTSYAIQAIYAAGGNPITGTWVISDTNPIEFLLSMQIEERGSFRWMEGETENLLATQQAIPALLGESLPYRIYNLEKICPYAFLEMILKK